VYPGTDLTFYLMNDDDDEMLAVRTLVQKSKFRVCNATIYPAVIRAAYEMACLRVQPAAVSDTRLVERRFHTRCASRLVPASCR